MSDDRATGKARVCIVSPFAYGALTGGRRGHAGGVEQQTTMCARWLASRGHDVALITWDEGQKDGEVIDGVRVLKMRKREAGPKGLRFFQRWQSLNAALQRADADVYYQNCGDYVTGQVAAWCTRRGRRFVYSVASDPDCDRRLPKLPELRERMLYRFGLKRAHAIVTQTSRQRSMLNNNFALNAIVLPMPCPPLPGAMAPADARREPPAKASVLWIGRISPVKRFDVLLDLAERMPDVSFEIAGKPDQDDEYSSGLLRRAERYRNVKMHGLVSRDRLPGMYRNATAVLCTSDYEGFPNTFLEAWSFGTPVVSTVDPDGLLASKGLGLPVHSLDEMQGALRSLIADQHAWRQCSLAGFEYVVSRHRADVALGQLEAVLLDQTIDSFSEPSLEKVAAPVEAPIKVCFIAHPAWGEMSGGRKGEIGGIQRQLSLMARWFAARGHEVSLLTWDEGQPDEVMIGGVRVIKMCRRDEGIPFLRFVHPRWTSLAKAMRRADAQVYYQNTAEVVTGQAAFWCRHRNRSLVFSVANDWDCDPAALARLPMYERQLYLFGLKRADLVVAQTATQQRILLESHGVASTVVKMPSPPTVDMSVPIDLPDLERPRVVWVGRIAEAKRLEVLLDVAELAPEVSFEVAGIPDPPSDYADALLKRAESIPNVRMLGRVERSGIPGLYRGAVCLCCTSFHEGFPNTFLEAWSQGVPLVTTFDPDGLVAADGLGGVAEDAPGVVREIRRLIASPEDWLGASQRARRYYIDNHLPENVVPRFEALFRELVSSRT